MDKIPRLETERLQLRAIFPSDAREIFDIYSDPKVAASYDFEPFEDLRQASELIDKLIYWFQHDIALRWAMVEKKSSQVVGTCCFDTFQPNFHSCNLGYNVRSDRWNTGFATEAAKSIIDYAFSAGLHYPINRITAITLPANAASEKVLTKIGFEKEGLLRQYGYWKNQYHDMNLFSLINDKLP